MARLQQHWIVVSLFLAVSSGSFAQTTSSEQVEPAPTETLAVNLPAAANPKVASSYLFPDGKQQFRNYLYSTFGPPALISTAVGAALDQNKPAPPEWDSGAQGYGERYGWRFGMQIIGHTTEYSLAALVHEDVAYHRCECQGFIPRGSHALISTLTARTRSSGTIFSIPSLVGPYAGSFAAVNAWYPSRYEPADALRIGSTSFVFKAVGNLIGEFIAPRR